MEPKQPIIGAKPAEPRMSFGRQAAFWALATIVLIAFLTIFSSILLPFFAGILLAYFLDPIADRLENLGMSRLMAAITILLAFVLAFVAGLLVVVPLLVNQVADFAARVPEYVDRLQDLAGSFQIDWLTQRVGIDETRVLEGLDGMLAQGGSFVTGLLGGILTGGMALVNTIGLLVVAPVVAFYMLLDWDRMVARVDALIPRQNLGTVRQIFRDIDASVAGFIRGQGTLCLILGAFYAIGLTLVGLNFGLLIGLFAGLISFIPYIGSIVGLVLSVGVALVQFWPDWVMVAAVAGIFFSGQFIEGNILQPKLVGGSVGLHPVWLMFALFAFGFLFGFPGLLVAVPAAAAVGVLVRFAVRRYEASPLYRGSTLPPPDAR